MKQNKEKVGSVGIKVGIIISILLLVILGCKSVYDSTTSYNLAVKNHEKYERKKLKSLARGVEGRFKKAYETGASLVAVAEAAIAADGETEMSRASLIDIVKSIYLTNPELSGLGIYFEPNGFDGKDASFVTSENKTGAMVAYVYGKKGSLSVKTSDYHIGKEWYTEPVKTGKVSLLPPLESSSGELVVTYAMPIMVDGKVVGAINADVGIDDISDKMAGDSPENNEHDFTVLLTDTGVIAAHSIEKSRVMRNVVDENPKVKEYLATTSRNEEVIVDGVSQLTGKESRMIYVPVKIDGTDSYWAVEAIATKAYFVKDAANGVVINIVVSLFAIIIIAGVTFIILDKMVSKPLELLSIAIKKFADYDLDISKEAEIVYSRGYLKVNDRVGMTMRAMGELNKNLVEIIKEINAHAQTTAATAEELTSTAQSTADMASDVAGAVENIAECATSQAQDTQNAAVSAENSGRYIMEMIETIKELAEATDIIDKCKNDGNATLKELVKITDENREISGKVSRVIDETSQATEKISSASEMIQSISDQTNLLALNAAIEAARAGEAGKGFAVVADEIRKLAEQSAGFTAEIRAVIDELKVKAESAVSMMEDSSKMVISQSEKVDETSEKFDEISRAVENSKTIVTTINEASKTMEAENSNVIRIIENISAVAEENAATTEEAAASVETQTKTIEEISHASDNLAQIAMDLQNEVSKFRL